MLDHNEKVAHIIFANSDIDSKGEYTEDFDAKSAIICVGGSIFSRISCEMEITVYMMY